MITKRTKIQLVIFVLITMIGVAYVGARYARLDRLFYDDSYVVTAHFEESGGIFAGAEVSYRGVTIGEVSSMELTDEGVDVNLEIENSTSDIPEDTRALVGNRSAVGEQYVELQPEVDEGPYLENGSEIPVDMTATPIASSKLLVDIDTTVNSVNKASLRTVVSEFGTAFQGTGRQLGRIIDTSNSFIRTANDNFDITTALLEDGNVVLSTQLDKSSAIKSFSRDLSLVSDTLVSSDADLRRVIETGGATASQLRSFLEENKVDLGELINGLVTTGEVTGRHIDGTEMILVVYPYVVAGGYTVVDKDPDSKMYDAHFGLILNQDPPVCHVGYGSTDTRSPYNRGDRPMNEKAHCSEPQATTNARGAQHAPKRAGAAYRAPVVGAYDSSTGKFSWTGKNTGSEVTYDGGAAKIFGEESWKWLLLQPLVGEQQRDQVNE